LLPNETPPTKQAPVKETKEKQGGRPAGHRKLWLHPKQISNIISISISRFKDNIELDLTVKTGTNLQKYWLYYIFLKNCWMHSYY